MLLVLALSGPFAFGDSETEADTIAHKLIDEIVQSNTNTGTNAADLHVLPSCNACA